MSGVSEGIQAENTLKGTHAGSPENKGVLRRK